MKKILCFLFLLCSCAKNEISENLITKNFDPKKYMGTWYEIARTDNKFEKDLINVKATYTLKDNGKIEIINNGYNTKKQKEKSIKGVGYLVKENIGQLKISFFRPFYSYYNVIFLDKNYQYAVVVGNNYDYLWILSRNPKMSNELYNTIISKIKNIGFDISKIKKY